MSKVFAALLARRFAPLDFSSVPGFPHPVPDMSEWGDFLPSFKESKEDNPAEHLIKFHECMDLLDLQHEDVRMKMFMFSLYGDARQWYFSLPPSSISSLKDFHKAFTEHCKRYFSDEFAFDNCCDEYELHCKLEDVNIERAPPHNMPQPVNDLQDVVFSHQHELQMDYKETKHSLTILKSDCYEVEELVPLATQRDDHKCIHDVANDGFEECVATGDIYHCDQNIGDLRMDNHSIDAFDIVSNASTYLGCHEDEIVPFENPKSDYQIDTLAGDSVESTVDVEGSSQFFGLQMKADCNRYLQEGDELKISDQQCFLYNSLTEDERSVVNIETSDGEEEQRSSDQQLGLHSFSTEEKWITFSIETSESNQQLQYSHLDWQFKEVFLSDIYDPVDNYFESMSSKCVKAFWSEEDCPYHLFKPLFRMIWLPLFFGSRSSIMLVNQFLTWLHWKHDFT
jgi:hypothetical protein